MLDSVFFFIRFHFPITLTTKDHLENKIVHVYFATVYSLCLQHILRFRPMLAQRGKYKDENRLNYKLKLEQWIYDIIVGDT